MEKGKETITETTGAYFEVICAISKKNVNDDKYAYIIGEGNADDTAAEVYESIYIPIKAHNEVGENLFTPKGRIIYNINFNNIIKEFGNENSPELASSEILTCRQLEK